MAYRLLTCLATERHRHRFSDEQVELFAELWATERPSTPIAGTLWLAHAFIGAAMAALGTRLDARRQSRRALAHRGAGHGGGQLGNDLRFTWRALRRSPWYSLTAVGVVAMTLALATTVFAVVDGVLFRPLGYPAARDLVVIEPGFEGQPPLRTQSGGRILNTVSQVDLDNWQAAVPEMVLTGFSAQPWSGMGGGLNGDAVGVARVQANFFDVIGVAPAVGGFTQEDFATEPLLLPMIISDRVWRARFSGDSGVMGREVVTDPARGSGYRVVGVMPEGFIFPANTMLVDFITPLVRPAEARHDPTTRGIYVALGRAPDDVSLESLEGRLAAGVAETIAQFPPQGAKPDGWSEAAWRRQGPYDQVHVRPLGDYLGQDSRPMFQAVSLAVAVLMALVAINLSSLMSSRVVERRRELDVRLAMGAPWTAIARLMVAEAGVLVALGAALGVAAAMPLLKLALSLLPEEVVLLKSVETAGIDWRVAGFAVLMVLTLTVLIAVAPLWRSRRQAVAAHTALGASERTRTMGRFVVVASQVAGAFVLTVLGALLVGSVLSVYANERPIRTDNVAIINVMLQGPGATMDVSAERTERTKRLVERLKELPGVRSVGVTASQVLVGGGEMSWFERPPQAMRLGLDTQAVTAEFYQTLELQLVAGRLPTDTELATSAPVVVVGESVARAFWPDAPPIGQTLVDQQTQQPFEVVGVVRDVRWTSWDRETASIYGPYALLSRAPWLNIFIGTDGRTGQVLTEAVRTITDTDPLARPRTASTLDNQFRDSIRMRRFQSWLFGTFAVVALGVVGVGVLGLLAMTAARRTKEIGIRNALGATRAGVLRWLWLEEQVPVSVGLLVGGAIAAWATSLVSAYLYGVTPFDVRVWLTAAVLILVTAGVGAFVPAWRASRIDPLKALRTE